MHRKRGDELLPRLLSVKTRLERSTLASEHAIRLRGAAENASDQSIWPISAELNRQRIVVLNLREIHRLMLKQNLEVSDNITIQQMWDGIVRGAARTMTLYEELLSSDLLRFSHSFL